MRQVLVIILSIFYLLSSSGFTMYEHYCMGELAQTSISDNVSDNDRCSKCGMENKKGEDNGCCKDEQKFVKSDDQNTGYKLVINKSLIASAGLPTSYISCNNSLHSLYSSNVNTGLPHAPPNTDIHKHPIFIRVQSLLI